MYYFLQKILEGDRTMSLSNTFKVGIEHILLHVLNVGHVSLIQKCKWNIFLKHIFFPQKGKIRPWKNMAHNKGKESIWKAYIVYDFNYVTLWKNKTMKKIKSWSYQGRGGERMNRQSMNDFLGRWKYSDIIVKDIRHKTYSAGSNARMNAEALQSCLTLCHPMDYSPPGSSIHGIFRARVLEWVAVPFSRGSSRPRYQTRISYVSCIGRGFFTTSATWEAPSK